MEVNIKSNMFYFTLPDLSEITKEEILSKKV